MRAIHELKRATTTSPLKGGGGGLLLLLDIHPFNWYCVRVKRVGSARPRVEYHNWVKKITVYINTLILKFCMLCLYGTMMHTRVFQFFSFVCLISFLVFCNLHLEMCLVVSGAHPKCRGCTRKSCKIPPRQTQLWHSQTSSPGYCSISGKFVYQCASFTFPLLFTVTVRNSLLA